MSLSRREAADLDRHITGNFGEKQFDDDPEIELSVCDKKTFKGWKLCIIVDGNTSVLIPITETVAKLLTSAGIPQQG